MFTITLLEIYDLSTVVTRTEQLKLCVDKLF